MLLVTPLVNLQCAVGAALIVLLAVGSAVTRRGDAALVAGDKFSIRAVVVASVLMAVIGLWLGSFELDRFFAPEAARVSNPAMARQTALSMYWGVYAIALVALGFWKRTPWVRYAGLGLLALTLGKVMLVDLAKVQYVYRVLSLLAVGLLFIGTSVAYARLASRASAK